jgi:hypothetical protein
MYLSPKDAKGFGINLGHTSWGPIVMDLPRRTFQLRGDKGTYTFEKIKKVYYRRGLARWIFPVWIAGLAAGQIPGIEKTWALYGTVGSLFGLFVAGLFNKDRVLGYVCVETETGMHYFRHVKRHSLFSFSEEKTKGELLAFLSRLV